MPVSGDELRSIAESLTALASSLEGGSTIPSVPTIPDPMDCLGGVWPTQTLPYPISYPPSDVPSGALDIGHYDRKMANCPDGTVLVIGDSLVQALPTFKIGPYVEGFGVGGETLRRCINRISRGGLIRRAGAVVLASGINELANFAYYSPYTPDQITNNLAFMHAGLAAQATGKWVIRDIIPVDEPRLISTLSSDYEGMNFKIKLANQRIRAAWAVTQAQVEFVGLEEELADPSGNLADVYHIDGLHLTRAGDDIQTAGIRDALQRLEIF